MNDAPAPGVDQASPEPPNRRRFPLLVGAAVGAAALVIASLAWSLAGDDEARAPTTSMEISMEVSSTMSTETPTATSTGTVPVDPPAPQPIVPVRAFEAWPDPPTDHDPHVLSIPGNGALVADADGRALVYVNSIGRPTVVDLETGDRQELDIAPTRRFDRFDVDDGHVVSVSGRAARDGGAGSDAITVRVHRPQLFQLPSANPTTGIDLCLAAVCPQLVHAAVDEAGRADPRVEVLGTGGDADLAQLLSGASGRDGRFDTVVFEGVATRIPTPGSGPIWTVRES